VCYLSSNIPESIFLSNHPGSILFICALLLGQITAFLAMAVKLTCILNPRGVYNFVCGTGSVSPFSLQSQEIRQELFMALEDLLYFGYRTELLKASTFKNIFDCVNG
jgi:hypothetical protein